MGHSMAIGFTSEPPNTARKSRKLWRLLEKIHGQTPKRLWKNPNCWGGGPSGRGYWGFWGVEVGFSSYNFSTNADCSEIYPIQMSVIN